MEQRLIVVFSAESDEAISVIKALLEYPEEWSIRAITKDPTSEKHQVGDNQNH